MSIFPTHDISQNLYYHSFYSYNPADDPTVIKSFLYDNNQSLVDSTDISFGSANPYDVIAFLENSGTNPYAIGKVGTDFRSMDITFGSVFKKSFKESQRQVLMTYVDSTYKNVHGTANQILAVTVSNASGSNRYYLDGSTSPGQTILALTAGYYVFDQSDSTNVTHPLVIGETDGAGTYYSSMITEGTIGSLNGYTTVDISAGTPDLYYYCSAHSGMGGQILNFMSATSYTVTVVNSVTHGQNIYAIDGSTDYYDAGSLVFNAGTKYAVNVSALNDTSYNVVFGTTIDDSSSIVNDTSIVNQNGDNIYVYPQQTLYMFDRNIEYMTKPLTYNNYMFKTSGTLTLQMTTPTVNYYLLNGGGGGGRGQVTTSKVSDSEAGAGGAGGTSLHGTAIFSDVGNYTIVIGNGLSGSSTKNANNSGGGITSISGSGVNVQTSGQIDPTNGGPKQWWYYNDRTDYNGKDGLVENFNFGAGGGSGGVVVQGTHNFSPGNGGYNGGGNGGLYYQDGFNGQANTGGGGGGGGCGHTKTPYRFYNRAGGSGGSGVAIIRLPERKFTYSGSYQETTLEFP